MTDEIVEFLDEFHYIYPNLNDTFGYAAADSERIVLGEDNSEKLAAVWRAHGSAGIRAYCAKVRGCDPLGELMTPEYEAAVKMLEGWEYEPD